MNRSRCRVAIHTATGALFVLAACSTRGATAAAQTGGSKAGAANASTGNACDRKLLVAADVAGILRTPITGNGPIPGDPQSCKFDTGNYASITVTVRGGMGKTTVDSWKSGRMPVQATPLSGVGDEAVWVGSLHEVISEKGNALCDIQVMGIGGDFVGSASDQQRSIGALCNKIFAALK